ncbi:MAG: hypothetical protein LUD79_08250 [Oscillospiraceae bacterium]|nr:hypothetical protein [Oscillospiraceae bacterium]
MKINKVSAILSYLASLVFYITAVINFFSDTGYGAVYLCLGSVFLCLGAFWLNRDNDKKDDDEK